MVFKKGCIAWNKGKNKKLLPNLSGGRSVYTCNKVDRYCLYCGKFLGKQYINAKRKRTFCNVSHEDKYHNPHRQYSDAYRKSVSDRVRNSSIETRKKWSDNAKKQGLGGLISSKCFNYKGTILHSTYELNVAKSLDANNVRWVRPKPLSWIDANMNEHLYYPDFYLIDYNTYLDPKNDYLIIKDSDKINRVIQYNNVKVLILDKNQLSWQNINDLISSKITDGCPSG